MREGRRTHDRLAAGGLAVMDDEVGCDELVRDVAPVVVDDLVEEAVENSLMRGGRLT
jgi:hypothetical protein